MGSVAIPVGVLAIASGLWEGGVWLLSFWFRIVDQSFLRVASYRDLLGDDGLVWTVIGVVEGLGLVGCLCPLRRRHRPGGAVLRLIRR